MQAQEEAEAAERLLKEQQHEALVEGERQRILDALDPQLRAYLPRRFAMHKKAAG